MEMQTVIKNQKEISVYNTENTEMELGTALKMSRKREQTIQTWFPKGLINSEIFIALQQRTSNNQREVMERDNHYTQKKVNSTRTVSSFHVCVCLFSSISLDRKKMELLKYLDIFFLIEQSKFKLNF